MFSKWWREFMGPLGRELVGHSVNLTHSPEIGGITINMIAIAITAIAFVAMVGYMLIRRRGIRNAIGWAFENAFAIMVGCWVLMSLNALYNFVHIFQLIFIPAIGRFSSVVLIFAMGYLATVLLWDSWHKLDWLEAFGLSWLIGMGIVFVETVFLSVCRISLSFASYFWMTAAVLLFQAAAIAQYKKAWRISCRPGKLNHIGLWIVGLLLIGSVLISSAVPIYSCDAKFYGRISLEMFQQGKAFHTGDMSQHPWLVPIVMTWEYFFMNVPDSQRAKIIFPITYAAMIFLFLSNLLKYVCKKTAILFTFLLVSFPLMLYHSTIAYHDLTMAAYYMAGMIYLYDFMQTWRRGPAILSAIFLGLGVNVKSSGTPLMITGAVVMALYLMRGAIRWRGLWKIRMEGGWVFFPIVGALSLPWIIGGGSLFRRTANFASGEFKGQTLNVAGRVIENVNMNLPTIAHTLANKFVNYADWHLLWVAVPLISIFYFWKLKHHAEKRFLFLAVVANVAMIFFVFTRPNYFIHLVDGTLVQRLIMHISPFALYYLAIMKGRVEWAR